MKVPVPPGEPLHDALAWSRHPSSGAETAGTRLARPRDPQRPRDYFLFLRWIRVFLSSLRCFFFAIRLRRFLMTEPMRPLSLRHNGRRARHRSPAAGRLGTRPKCRKKRERQPLTQSSSLPGLVRCRDCYPRRRLSATRPHHRQDRSRHPRPRRCHHGGTTPVPPWLQREMPGCPGLPGARHRPLGAGRPGDSRAHHQAQSLDAGDDSGQFAPVSQRPRSGGADEGCP